MLIITGEVRKVIDDPYTDRDGNTVNQKVVVLEPSSGRQNFEVFLTGSQVNAGIDQRWLKLKGKVASIEVSLYVNYQYRFYKYSAVGDGEPILQGK